MRGYMCMLNSMRLKPRVRLPAELRSRRQDLTDSSVTNTTELELPRPMIQFRIHRARTRATAVLTFRVRHRTAAA